MGERRCLPGCGGRPSGQQSARRRRQPAPAPPRPRRSWPRMPSPIALPQPAPPSASARSGTASARSSGPRTMPRPGRLEAGSESAATGPAGHPPAARATATTGPQRHLRQPRAQHRRPASRRIASSGSRAHHTGRTPAADAIVVHRCARWLACEVAMRPRPPAIHADVAAHGQAFIAGTRAARPQLQRSGGLPRPRALPRPCPSSSRDRERRSAARGTRVQAKVLSQGWKGRR